MDSKEELKRKVFERGRRIKEIEDEEKALKHEIQDRQQRLSEIAVVKDRELYAVKALEELLPESDRWTEWHRSDKKDGHPLALPTLIAKVLENEQAGLPSRRIEAEVRKLGWHTESRNPHVAVTTALHRRDDLFFNMKNKNWCLKKYAEPRPSISGTLTISGLTKPPSDDGLDEVINVFELARQKREKTRTQN
jgi:hypothetical protein